MFAITVGYGIALPILPFLIERVAGTVNPSTLSRHTGLLTGIYILAIFMFAPLWGKLSDRKGRRPVMLLGLVGFAVTVALFVIADSLVLLYVSRFLSGLFAAAITPVAYALVGDHAPSREWRAHRFALINIAGTAGFFVGPLLGGLSVRAAGAIFNAPTEGPLVTPFVAAAALALVAGIAVWALVPTTNGRSARAPTTSEDQIGRTAVRRLWAVAFVTAVAIGAFEVGLALRGKQVLGLDAARIGLMFAECSLVMFIVQALVFSPLIKPEQTRWFISPGLVVLGVSLVIVSFTNTSITMSIAVALVATSAGILSPIVTYWVSYGTSESQGADLGSMTAAASLGQALGSAAGGLLFDVPVLRDAGFIAAALIVFAGLLASAGLPRLLMQTAAETIGPACQRMRR